jgi:hypothetical protein
MTASGVLTAIGTYFENHPGRDFLVYYIVMVMIDNMPSPMPNGNSFYRWFFGVAQVLAANLIRSKKGVQGQLGSGSNSTPPNPTSQPVQNPGVKN